VETDTPQPDRADAAAMPSKTRWHVAIDLGAGSGRAFLGAVGPDRLVLDEVHRFHYGPRLVDGHLRWDAAQLFDGLLTGLRNAHTRAIELGVTPRDSATGDTHVLDSVGVDSWAVDYGLIDAEGRLLEDPICYRDERTAGVLEMVLSRMPREALFARTGIQFLPLNTLYQLVAHVRDGLNPDAAHLLLIPDLCHHFLCGSLVSERTNASTTQLIDVRTGTWDERLFTTFGLPRALMPDLVDAGTELGRLRPEHGLGPVRVLAPATHDTASAVAGTPLERGWAFISSGTWSLVGVERDIPRLDVTAAHANFTNEAGVRGTVRFLTNVMGLWLLESCRKEWAADGFTDDLPTLLARVAALPGVAALIYPDAPRFFAPASMTRELRASLAETGHPDHADPVLLAKVILDSLAARYASVLETVETLTGRPVPGVHIVGGGCLNTYLNQATADSSGRPVVAGPVEATAVGNLIVQAIASGVLGSLADARGRVGRTVPMHRFEPRAEHAAAWADARSRYRELEQTARAAHSR
jgi:rhamnulokinase